MNKSHSTYTSGFNMIMDRDVTYADLIQICYDLNQLFDQQYHFAPEPITDGFIYFKNYKDDHSGRYKSMRIHPHRILWVNEETVFNDFLNNNDVFIPKTKKDVYSSIHPTKTTTFLKAFRGAPAWTIDELNKFKTVFEKYGIHVKKMPSKKSLTQ